MEREMFPSGKIVDDWFYSFLHNLWENMILKSYVKNIAFKNCYGTGFETYLVKLDENQYELDNISYENINIEENDKLVQGKSYL